MKIKTNKGDRVISSLMECDSWALHRSFLNGSIVEGSFTITHIPTGRYLFVGDEESTKSIFLMIIKYHPNPRTLSSFRALKRELIKILKLHQCEEEALRLSVAGDAQIKGEIK